MTIRPRRRTRSEPNQRGGGEPVDRAAAESIRLAHRALDRFPDLVRRHRYVAGGAAVAGALVVLASVAIARRMRQGETAEEAVAHVTAEEIESLHRREREQGEQEPASEEPPAATDGAEVPRPAPLPLRSNGVSSNHVPVDPIGG